MGKHHEKYSKTAARAPADVGTDAGAAHLDLPGATVVDGSQLEGGGQILRNAAAVAAITRAPVAIHSIRAGRSKPGLSPQHLTGLQLVAAMCGGTLRGGAARSTAISLEPGRLACGHYLADTHTAGSCTLMVQQALPCMLFAAAPPATTITGDADAAAAAADAAARWSQLDLRGGTDAAFAPPIGYLQHVLAPTLSALLPPSAGLQISLLRRGFYPRGGGRALVRARALAPGERLPPLDAATRGKLVEVRVLAFSAGKVPHSDAQRMATAAAGALQDALAGPHGSTLIFGPCAGPAAAAAPAAVASAAAGADSGAAAEQAPAGAGGGGSDGDGSSGSSGVAILQEVTREGESTAVGDGGGVLLVARSDTGRVWGASAAWERGVPPGSAGKAAAEELLEVLASGACVDGWMQDQLIIWMALAGGTSRMVCGEPSLHTRTAIAVASQLLPAARFTVTRLPAAGGSGSGDRSGADSGGGGGGSGSKLHAAGSSDVYLIECEGAGIEA